MNAEEKREEQQIEIETNVDADIDSFISDQEADSKARAEQTSLSIYEQSELADEEQIDLEYKGAIITEYFYMFRNKQGKMIKGISYAGIKAIISNRGNMSILSHELIKEDGFWYATVKIKDIKRNLEGLGISECSLMKPFARRIALSKALRNAYRSIIDEAMIVKMVDKWEKL